MTENNPVTHERLKLTPLSHHFPVIFNNGVVVRNLMMACTKCQGLYTDPNQVCGNVKKLGPSEYLIEGAGHCESCHQTSVFDFKIFDDHSISHLVDGEWKVVGPDGRKDVTPPEGEQVRSTAIHAPARKNPSQDELMAKLGSVLITLRILWIGGFIWSIMPALQETQNGSYETFFNTFLINGALIAVGYICSVILAVNHLRKK